VAWLVLSSPLVRHPPPPILDSPLGCKLTNPFKVMLEKGIIPPNALFEKINPEIDADLYHVEVRNTFQAVTASIPLTQIQGSHYP
jgi:hypothetical protein